MPEKAPCLRVFTEARLLDARLLFAKCQLLRKQGIPVENPQLFPHGSDASGGEMLPIEANSGHGLLRRAGVMSPCAEAGKLLERA